MTVEISSLSPNVLTSITYPVVEMFHSVQGEGTWAGTNAFFIRLGGCDVGCSWCDTKESWPMNHHPQESLKRLLEAAKGVNPSMVVITGGEPLLHDLHPLTEALHGAGLCLHLETSGAHPFSGCFDWVTFSPKRFKPPHESIYKRVDELKVVVCDRADLEWAELQGEKVGEFATKYLQPEWNSPSSQKLVFDYVLAHPDWRISLQTHKFLGVL